MSYDHQLFQHRCILALTAYATCTFTLAQAYVLESRVPLASQRETGDTSEALCRWLVMDEISQVHYAARFTHVDRAIARTALWF